MFKSISCIMTALYLMLASYGMAFAAPGVGDLVINEIMYNPSSAEPDTEWFEVRNISGATQDIGGCTISDGEGTHTIVAGTTIPIGAYFVFGYSNSITGVAVNYVYNGGSGNGANIQLAGSGDQITIECGGTVVDSVSYGGSSPWPSDTNGRAISFGVPTGGGTNYATLNDTGDNWKHSTTTIGSGNADRGTPGSINDDVLGANAITLHTLSAQPTGINPGVLALPMLGLIGAGGVALYRRRQKETPATIQPVQREAATGYAPPAITYESRLEVRAGSPLSPVFDPTNLMDPLNQLLDPAKTAMR